MAMDSVVVIVVETAMDAAEVAMFPSVLVGDIAEYAEFKEALLLTGVEVEQVLSEGTGFSPGSGHSLKGER
jgi:hypothetical protein